MCRCCVTCVILADLGEEGEERCCMLIIKLWMLNQRSQECEVEDLEAERDIELSLDLLQEGLS